MKIFEFDSYKIFVKTRIDEMPSGGRGQFRLIAENLKMHTTLVSQVFNGNRHLTMEQGCDLCHFWGLNELETEMFLALIQFERAGSVALQQIIRKQIEFIRTRAGQLSQRLPKDKKLSETTQAIFYSNWYYSGIRLLTSIPSFRSVDSIASYLDLPRPLVSRVIEFLLANNLCVEKDGQLAMGQKRTHLSSESPLITRHHTNWRIKEMEKIDKVDEKELMVTSPLSISEKDFAKVRKEILNLVDKVSDIVSKTEPEKLSCLNIGWFDL